MNYQTFPEELKQNYSDIFSNISENKGSFREFLKNEVVDILSFIQKFDKKYLLGAFGYKLIENSPTMLTSLDPDFNIHELDEQIEVFFEYLLNLSTTKLNDINKPIPSKSDIDSLYKKINDFFTQYRLYLMADGYDQKENLVNFEELELRMSIITETLTVRGKGYDHHMIQIFEEIYQKHDEFILNNYGFTSIQFLEIILKLNKMVGSKIANSLGVKCSHERLINWIDKNDEKIGVENRMRQECKHFIQLFCEDNEDLTYDEDENGNPKIVFYETGNISGSDKVFRVIPENEIEERIFKVISIEFGQNSCFLNYEPEKGFPLGDSVICLKPLIFENGKYFHFSSRIIFRNMFEIIDNLIKQKDNSYYSNKFLGNSNKLSRDNYIEQKTKELFQNILHNSYSYHSLKYNVEENGQIKDVELDLLFESDTSIYLVGVKAGEFNKKHRRGAIKGIKDQITETLGKGVSQSIRACDYIQKNDIAIFEYVKDNNKKQLSVCCESKKIYKIVVSLEHYSFISVRQDILMKLGLINSDVKWTWIVSIFDLMIFADLINNEDDFLDYLDFRFKILENPKITFSDEIDILGCFLANENSFFEKVNDYDRIMIPNYAHLINDYYTKLMTGLEPEKPTRKKTNSKF